MTSDRRWVTSPTSKPPTDGGGAAASHERPSRGGRGERQRPPLKVMTEATQADAFVAFLERHRGEAHVAALQDYPDPDAISSALAYRALAARMDIDAATPSAA